MKTGSSHMNTRSSVLQMIRKGDLSALAAPQAWGKTKAMALSCRKVRAWGRNHAMVIRRKERVTTLEL
jgi:hypothetical protein